MGLAAVTADEHEHEHEAPSSAEPGLPLENAERRALLEVLEQHRWNITGAAAALGMSRKTVYRKMKKHGIQPASVRG